VQLQFFVPSPKLQFAANQFLAHSFQWQLLCLRVSSRRFILNREYSGSTKEDDL